MMPLVFNLGQCYSVESGMTQDVGHRLQILLLLHISEDALQQGILLLQLLLLRNAELEKYFEQTSHKVCIGIFVLTFLSRSLANLMKITNRVLLIL